MALSNSNLYIILTPRPSSGFFLVDAVDHGRHGAGAAAPEAVPVTGIATVTEIAADADAVHPVPDPAPGVPSAPAGHAAQPGPPVNHQGVDRKKMDTVIETIETE